MWTQAKSNRIVYEREKVKDHVMHIERLRSIKPTIQITRPKKPSHLKTNAKREMLNLGKNLSNQADHEAPLQAKSKLSGDTHLNFQ